MFSLIKLAVWIGAALFVLTFFAAKSENPLVANMFPITTSAAAAESFDKKLAGAAASAAMGERSVTVTWNESEVSSKITAVSRGTYGPNTGLQVHLTGGIRLLQKMALLGNEFTTGASVIPSIENGALKLKVDRVLLGSFDVTWLLGGQVQGVLETAVQPIRLALPGTLQSVTADGGLLTITTR